MGNSDMIGHDPLAWIKEESTAERSAEARVEEAAPAPVPSTPEPVAAEPAAAPVQPPPQEEPVVQQQAPIMEQQAEPEPAPVAVAPAAVEEDSGQIVMELGEQLAIATVAKVRAGWMDKIASGVQVPVVLDGGKVQSIDTAGLQLVISLIRELGEGGVSWRWGERSETLQSSVEQLGLNELMAL